MALCSGMNADKSKNKKNYPENLLDFSKKAFLCFSKDAVEE